MPGVLVATPGIKLPCSNSSVVTCACKYVDLVVSQNGGTPMEALIYYKP